MYREYNKTELEQLKKAELIIVRDFAEVCEKYNIPWFAIGGSVIGAARHEGFIPWDDDFDLAMLREDYDRFVEIWKTELGDKYHLATPETDASYSSPVIKLMRKNTKFVPEYLANSKAELGIHVDIFVYDNYTNDSKSKKQIKQARILDQLLFLRGSGKPSIPFKGIKKVLAGIACELIHAILTIFRISPAWLYKKFNKVAQRYNAENTEYVTLYQDAWIHESRVARSEIFPLKRVKFEDTYVPVPNEYMKLLYRYYGEDVMEMPPIEKRVNHAPIQIEFGDMMDGLELRDA